MSYRVVGPRLLVKQLPPSETRSPSGIVLPQELTQDEVRGVVVGVGDPRGEHDWAQTAEVGDVVIWDDRLRPTAARPPRVTIVNDVSGTAEEFVVLHFFEVLLVLALDEVAETV